MINSDVFDDEASTPTPGEPGDSCTDNTDKVASNLKSSSKNSKNVKETKEENVGKGGGKFMRKLKLN